MLWRSLCRVHGVERHRNLRRGRIVLCIGCAHRANQYNRENISIPPRNVCSRLKTAAPMTRARKSSFFSAPMRVRGALSARNTGLRLRSIVSSRGEWLFRSRKQPRHEVHGSHDHAQRSRRPRSAWPRLPQRRTSGRPQRWRPMPNPWRSDR